MTTIATENNISQSLLDSVNGTGKTSSSTVNETQDRFLKLLVEQMKNQDPLNPMDNAQVTSQMAQLSTVTGIDKLNDTMAGMISSIQSGQSYQAANMIGHNVLIPGNEITNTEQGSFFGVDLATSVDKVDIAIKNASGIVVKNITLQELDAGPATVQWDGINDDGTLSPAGKYTFEARSTVGETTSAATPLTFATVSSVSTNTNGVKLNLSNSASVSMAEVKEIF
jgi:flagellar basal-body rod modification protein FlgD